MLVHCLLDGAALARLARAGGLENGADFGLFVYPLGITEWRRQESWRTFGASQYCMAPVRSNGSLIEFTRSCPWPCFAAVQPADLILDR